MSEFWLRKMRTYFHTFDFDKDGYISENDFAEMARRHADIANADPEKKEKLIGNFVNVYRIFAKAGDLEKESRLTVEVFVASMKGLLYDPDLIIEYVHLSRGLFDLLDVNNDGYLQPEEHCRGFDQIGVPEETLDRRVAFDALDKDHDGLISIGELIAGFFDFLFSEDENSPNKFFFGPLVD